MVAMTAKIFFIITKFKGYYFGLFVVTRLFAKSVPKAYQRAHEQKFGAKIITFTILCNTKYYKICNFAVILRILQSGSSKIGVNLQI